MMLYDVLKASKGLYVNDSFAMLWGKQLGGWKIAELTGTLPMTFRSNGTALINYRIYGTAEGVGERTENFFDKNATNAANGYVDGEHLKNDGTTSANSLWAITEYIPIAGGHIYTFNYGSLSSSPAICYYDNSKQFIQGVSYVGQNPKVVSIPSNVAYIRLSFMKSYADDIMFVQANSLPATYIPPGYKLPLTVTSGAESKDTDIYIGDSKLLSGDYVDYESGKIVRNGTPQDPPLPLPELETYKGTNTLDSTETVGEVTIKGKIKEA